MPDWLQIIFRTLASIVILFILTKVLGKRQISELSLFEYITGISIGNIAAYISLDLDNLWFLGIISLIVWVSCSVGIEFWTMKTKKVQDFVDGKGRALIRNGVLSKKMLRKERLTVDELLEQLRQKDVFRVADVEFAVMEPSGSLSVLLKKEFQPLTPDMLGWQMGKEQAPYSLIMDGQVLHEELQQAGHDEQWLKHELSRYSLDIKDVFLAQLDTSGELTFHTMDDQVYPNGQPTKPANRIQGLTHQLEAELRRLEGLARNESDRKMYTSALHHLNAGIEAMRLKNKP